MFKLRRVVTVLSISIAALISLSPQAGSEPFSAAKFHGKATDCGKGNFFDPRNGGECWSCNGLNRTLYAVTDSRACSKPAYTQFKRATKKRKNSHVGQGCPGGQFWDVKGGDGLLGACYSCSGWNRTAYAVDHARACSRRVKETLKPAVYKGEFLCKKGQFFDPRNGGECWSCPAGNKIRTVNAVTSKKACTNEPLNVFAVETNEMCYTVLAAMNQGEKGLKDLQAKLDSLVAPFKAKVDQEMSKLTSQVHTPAELKKMLADFGTQLKPYASYVDTIAKFENQVNLEKLKSILLDPKVVCDSRDLIQLVRNLKSAGMFPDLNKDHAINSDDIDYADMFVPSADAAVSKRPFHTFNLTVSLGDKSKSVPLTLIFVTDGKTDSSAQYSLLFAWGVAGGMDWPFELGASYILYPYSDISEFTNPVAFTGFGLGISLNIETMIRMVPALDEALDQLKRNLFISTKSSLVPQIPTNFEIAWGIGGNVPGIGISHRILPRGKEASIIGVSIQPSFALLPYKAY